MQNQALTFLVLQTNALYKKNHVMNYQSCKVNKKTKQNKFGMI